ncbi:dihydrofolate reductase [Paenibacillus nasutitermitis]|uniref:Dihydrofolate reductase n=1 Tax=Paenibacillus nasutitermitis TaxID=1652958 RepID=A0A917DSS6_9BACL|nr:dihydrofolate reductase [Paenibacillus nasutitermitis]GGD63646.1 dihydrofolate reductase [Paenibacillus nasutitermitis]
MPITMIAAMARNRVIGADNAMPWRLPAESAHFRRSTVGRTVLMGRKTFQSLGKPLKDRRNVILTRSSQFAHEGCEVVHSLDEALSRYNTNPNEELVVMGGEEVYKLFLPFADKLLLTEVEAVVEGDAYFPAFDENHWQLMDSEPYKQDDKNAYDFCIRTYIRKTPQS